MEMDRNLKKLVFPVDAMRSNFTKKFFGLALPDKIHFISSL